MDDDSKLPLTKGAKELLEQLPCYVSTNYQPAIELVEMKRAYWDYKLGVRFACGRLLPIPRRSNEVETITCGAVPAGAWADGDTQQGEGQK